jgi:hypothetical protein
MKKTPPTGFLLPVILIMLHSCASSRVNSTAHSPASVNTNLTEARLVADKSGPPVLRNEISIHAVRHFRKFFPAVESEKWYPIVNGFMAKYKKDDVGVRVDYDKRGKWLYTIRYYTESKLPKDVRKMVRSTWYDYAISSVEEIERENQLIYILHIHEGEDWKMIQVCNGEMAEVHPPGSAE